MKKFLQKLRAIFSSKAATAEDKASTTAGVPQSAHLDAPSQPIIPAVALSPEEMCGITADMTLQEVEELLAKLYKRYNQAASSLNPELQDEAATMLDAIVDCQEKFSSH